MVTVDAMGRRKITLKQEMETLLITLFAKAGEAELPDSLLRDRFASDAVRQIDYDFKRLKVSRDMMIGLGIRARWFDENVKEYIKRNPDAVIVHLGCGLDTRMFRVNPGKGITWFDVDYPEVVEFRRELYPKRDNYHLIGASVESPEWWAMVPNTRPAIVVAEGLVMYLNRDMQHLLHNIVGQLPRGEIIFDAFSSLGVWLVQRSPSVRATGAELKWGIDDPRDLAAWVPGLSFVEEAPPYDPSELRRFSFLSRTSINIMMALSPLRRISRYFRYRFQNPV